MPEGPTIFLLKEAALQFEGKKIIAVSGNTTVGKERFLHKKVTAFKTWGKHFLICFDGFTVRIHFLLFGSYLINEEKDMAVRLNLTFDNGYINFYASSIKILEGEINDHYDWTGDVMNDAWDEKAAKTKLKAIPKTLICDALIDQHIFAGVGNIIKNEILYIAKTHPKSKVGKVPPAKLKMLVERTRSYSFQFLEWKRQFILKKMYQVYNQKICKRCDLPIYRENIGVFKRRCFFCTNCQILYE